MIIHGIITEDYQIAPIDQGVLMKVQQPGNYCMINIDTEHQRSPIQLAKYWVELRQLCSNMSEESVQLLLQNIISNIAIHGKISEEYIHACLKAMHGIDSIALTVQSKQTQKFFDFAFKEIKKMEELFYVH